jgi:hypothetical protein
MRSQAVAPGASAAWSLLATRSLTGAPQTNTAWYTGCSRMTWEAFDEH